MRHPGVTPALQFTVNYFTRDKRIIILRSYIKVTHEAAMWVPILQGTKHENGQMVIMSKNFQFLSVRKLKELH